ncbi:hypothetical protein Vafri_5316 [Volvox africanus]|uniref:Secondary thiamine-phosphate synthase enzyme n=1 Tax=Volvox africanus TaxID=51714 RepID=A0A8J4AW23_9CHLO|nr:hypothetical protein Vafri_5316 [Volvox africanus]
MASICLQPLSPLPWTRPHPAPLYPSLIASAPFSKYCVLAPIYLWAVGIAAVRSFQILKEIGGSLVDYKLGLANIFIQHTSASLTINENADPDVRKDMETYLNLSVPEGPTAPWVHTDEGPDDMPAHVKSSLLGASLTIPISHGRLALGTWQGIWLCEHRDRASGRNIIVTLQGE